MDMDYDRQFITSTPIKSSSSATHSASRYDTPGTSYRHQQRPLNPTTTNNRHRLSGGASNTSSTSSNNNNNQYHKNCTRSSTTSTTSKLPQHNGSKNNNHITFDTTSSALNPKEAVARLRAELEQLKRDKSELALENEMLKSDLNQAIQDVDQLRVENEQLNQIIVEKEAVHTKLKSQLKTVTETAYTFYEKFVAFKCRYYKEVGLTGNHDWLERGDDH